MSSDLVRRILLTALMSLMAAPVAAQTAVLRGRVLDASDLRPIQAATVTIVGSGVQSLTDATGGFVISGVPPGLVSVQVDVLGYASLMESDVSLRTSRSTYVEFRLERRALELEGIVVGAPAFRVRDASPVSTQLLSNEELRRTPGGLQDVSRTLLSLPGVLGGVDNRNDLLVRGGGPGENAYYLDGIRIPQINHFATQGASGGALGLVNVDFIRETEFFAGAFPVRYGDALSSVLSIENRPGSPEGVRGDFTLGATEAALTLDGPAGTDSNWLFSLRRSYLQFLFEALGLPIRPDYWDTQFRFESQLSTRDRLLLVGIGALDNFDIVPPTQGDDFENFEIASRVIDNDQKSFTLGASWRRLIEGGYLTTTVSQSRSDFSFEDPGDDGDPVLANDSEELDTRLTLQADVEPRSGLSLALGIDASRAAVEAKVFQRAVPGGSFSEDLAWDEDLDLYRLSAFVQGTVGLGVRAKLTGGVRADEVTRLDEGFELSPRASVLVDLGGGVTVQGGGGLYHQAPSLIALSVKEQGVPVNLGLRQQRNVQFASGLAWTVNAGLRLSAEAFWKTYSRVPLLVSDPRISVSNLGGDYGFVGAEPLIDEGTGRARGVEVFAQQKLLGSVYVLGAYTLSWSEFAGSDMRLRPSAWDRRHALDLTGGYRVGAWEFGSKLRVLSGLATTPWDPTASEQSYAVTGRGVPDWARIGDVRTPGYARLDVRAERRLDFTSWNAVLFLDIQNVLNRENAVGFAYTEDPSFP
ncbi:MAG: TonB-dependent receptor, partial [Longimicrobiales bacterium]